MKTVLPAYRPEEEPTERQQKINAAIAKRRGQSMVEMAAEFASLEHQDEEAAKAQAERNILYAAIERLMVDTLQRIEDETGHDNWKGGGHTFSKQLKPRPIIESRTALTAWVKEQQMDDLLRLPDSELTRLIKEAFDARIAAMLTPETRAKLQPGDAGSMQPPPGTKVFLQTVVHHTTRSTPDSSEE